MRTAPFRLCLPLKAYRGRPLAYDPGMARKRLGNWNAVSGCSGWYYGLLRCQDDGSVLFEVTHPGSHETIGELRGSSYRTTTLARTMGVRDLKGYQQVAREAIRAQRQANG